MLASPSADTTIRLWSADTGEAMHTLEVHTPVYTVAFDPTSRILASGGSDGTVKLWDAASGKLIRSWEGHVGIVSGVTFNPAGSMLASGGIDGNVKLWDPANGKLRDTLEVRAPVYTVAFDPTSSILAAGGSKGTVKLWDAASVGSIRNLAESQSNVYSIAFDPEGRTIVCPSADTITVWDKVSGRHLRTMEGHTDIIDSLAFSHWCTIFASKSNDSTVRLWHCDSGRQLASIVEKKSNVQAQWPSLVFHPHLPLLATVGSDVASGSRHARLIHIWKLDPNMLLQQATAISTSHYVNAKVMLLGDTGVGKSGLSLVLNGQAFAATDSTPGRKVWTFRSEDVELENRGIQTRETLLWDLAGQPGYRVIHQLHLNEVAVALVVFDARSETDPLAGVRHWERALRLATQRQGVSCIPMKKFLVSARADRGTVSVSKERLEALRREFGFDEYFETSAKGRLANQGVTAGHRAVHRVG